MSASLSRPNGIPPPSESSQSLLEQTRKNYDAFFNSIDEFLFVLDNGGNIIHVNKTVIERLGYSEQELMGQSVLLVHPPERREEAGRIVGEMLAGKAEFCPVPLMAKSGERIPVETRVTAGTWNGAPAIFGVTKDMSRLKLSEEKFSKAFHSNSALMALSRFEDGEYIRYVVQ
jgi:PAS domain S-box-containing protein